ncbi:MAG: molybdenum cofactor biosynthesis protein [Planctomycetota bacterium]|nr:MAG: molybdenum cofactor biosynthesis protein [Planctomycetota bacterium]
MNDTLPQQIRIGRVVGIAVRTGPGAPMKELDEVLAATDGGLAGDNPSSPRRGVTLISQPQWRKANEELGSDLPWHTRRANVLVDAPSLGDLIGTTIALGNVLVRVEGETKPCAVMDAAQAGLLNALKPDGRGGVHGHILAGGLIRVGAEVRRVE